MVTNTYYTTRLYPLQDKVLKLLAETNSPFYLTGGTALSRGYYHHRYSDDLDLFLNQVKEYSQQIEEVLKSLNKLNSIIHHRSESYLSLTVEGILKLDFVNDVAFHSGKLLKKPLYPRVDNVINILSNKLSALVSRDEAKDVVDIITIASNNKINWSKIFTDANSKAVGIFPPDVVKRLNEFPLDLLDQIKWIGVPPKRSAFAQQVEQVSKQMLVSQS